jgi:peptidoglycan hydrolase FlgJ
MDLTPLISPTAAPAMPHPGATMDMAAARKAAQDFEAYFLQQTFESMFQGLGTNGLFGGGQGEAIYRSLLLQEYSKVAAEHGGVGIADAVQREIMRHQEVQP